MDKMNEKTINYDKDLNILNEKLKDFNLYDMLKFDNLNSDIEIDTEAIKKLIIALEKKTSEKFNIYSSKIKSIDLDVFKLQEEQKNINANISGYNISVEKMRQFKEDLSTKFDNLSKILEESISDLNSQINYLESYVKFNEENDEKKISEEKYIEFKKSEKRLSELITTGLEHINKNSLKKNRTLESISSDSNDDKRNYFKNLRQNLNNLEKFCKNSFDEINIKEIKARLLSLEKNTKNYLLYEDDIANINDKNRSQDIKIKEQTVKIYSIFQQASKNQV